ncbi:MAG: YraN family protein [Clostridia bacterium]|nr:YraN family protein [Clostridia bacterium]MBQ2237683.1 YraN family protein [Clostridia bacterium]MEE1185353.1 YraN family protein [Acutalibacteraceae bacterium]
MEKSVLGKIGEDLVADYVREKGMLVFRRNYRTKFGEIDVIAEDDTHIIFIEVKTRDENYMVSGAEAVDKAKQRRIRMSAALFMQKLPVKMEPRFDVAEVTVKTYDCGKKGYSLNYIEDAF